MASNNNSKNQSGGSALKTPENLSVSGGRKLTPKQVAARRRAQKRRRIQLIVVAAMVAVISAAMILLAISISQPTKFENLPSAATQDERPFEYGASDAKVTVEAYTDFQCSACKVWHDASQPRILNDYIKAGKSVKLVSRPIGFLDTGSSQRESHTTAEAAACAADQGRFSDYTTALYGNQPAGRNTNYWTNDRLKQLARTIIGFDSSKFNSCFDSNKYRQKINDDTATARNKGVTATPTFLVNGKPITGADYGELQKAIDEVLNAPTK